jgi:hypothetical protein
MTRLAFTMQYSDDENNILFEEKKIKLRHNWENRNYYAACHKTAVNFLAAKIYKIDF